MYLIIVEGRRTVEPYLSEGLMAVEASRMKQGITLVLDLDNNKFYDWTTSSWIQLKQHPLELEHMKGKTNERTETSNQRKESNNDQGVCNPGISQIDRLRWG